MSKCTYGNNFYQRRDAATRPSAEAIVPLLLEELPPVRSAVDFGCGTGTWLSVLKKNGVHKIRGYEGPWIALEYSCLAAGEIEIVDMRERMPQPEKCDLAMSLEVAEHLPKSHAADFVSMLCQTADYILFSAAIPFQKGRGHINEQWQEYWALHFIDNGFLAFDFLRPAIWGRGNVLPFLRQGILVFVRKQKVDTLRSARPVQDLAQLNLVHPAQYMVRVEQLTTFKGALKSLIRSALGWRDTAASRYWPVRK